MASLNQFSRVVLHVSKSNTRKRNRALETTLAAWKLKIMNSVCVSTIASLDGAANPFSPRSRLLLCHLLTLFFSIIQVAKFLLDRSLLLVSSLRHFFSFQIVACAIFSTEIRGPKRAHMDERFLWFTSSSLLSLRQFSDSIWFTRISTRRDETMQRTLIISTSKTLRLVVVRHPKGLFHSFFLRFPFVSPFCSALRF